MADSLNLKLIFFKKNVKALKCFDIFNCKQLKRKNSLQIKF